jgi:chromosome segregation ATPase
MTQPLINEASSAKKTDSHDDKIAGQPGDRDTFISDIREKLTKIQSKMTSMRDEGSRLAGDLKKKADENLTKLDAKYSELKSKLEVLKNSTGENWRADKEVFHKSFQELSTNFKGLFN